MARSSMARFVDGVVVDVVRCFPLPVRVVVGVRAGGALMGAGLVAVRGGGEELPLNETINAIPAARTSAARAATAPMSHRLVEATGRASVSGSSRVSSRRGASPSGAPSRIRTSPPGRGGVGLADWSLASSRTMSVGGITAASALTTSVGGGGVSCRPAGGGGRLRSPACVSGGGGGEPPAARARRTALSIAPRARWPGVPGGGSTACSSAIGSSRCLVPRTPAFIRP